MKIPAIKAHIGSWKYYVATLTFQQVNDYVEKIDDQLHKSEGLKDLIQRSITNNYLGIKEYIINQPEMFFNSLVLAVYNGSPKWIEVELNYGEEEFFDLGFLEFPNQSEKIFPVDGQHRVEGIKAALLENPEMANNKIGVIFIGHSTSDEGMQKSRRLFTTLNRYAKPVTMDDIIALDEDDSIAIVTRHLLENFYLFSEDRVTISSNKAILETDKQSITSIITLYQCNRELLKAFLNEKTGLSFNNKKIEKYLKFRPLDVELNDFQSFVLSFWNSFLSNLNVINEFNNSTDNSPALKFRNKDNGGNILFRPVGILPFIQAILEIQKRTGNNFDTILSRSNNLNLELDSVPWKFVLWNPVEKSMIMGSSGIVKSLILYMYGSNVIRPSEITALKHKYAARIGFEGGNLDDVLQHISILES